MDDITVPCSYNEEKEKSKQKRTEHCVPYNNGFMKRQEVRGKKTELVDSSSRCSRVQLENSQNLLHTYIAR